jgi:ABC-type sugar transport system ATPase subunit
VIKLIQLTKRYSNDTVLDGISMDICKGDVIGLIGPSGSGKSTVLRCIAGIEEYDTGKIIVDENCRIGMVFQNFNLFNNMSVIENLCYPQQKVLKSSFFQKIFVHRPYDPVIKMCLYNLDSNRFFKQAVSVHTSDLDCVSESGSECILVVWRL